MERHNLEFLWGWLSTMPRAGRGHRAFLAGYDANQTIGSLELLGGEQHIVLGVRAPDLVIEVDSDGEIYNVFTIEGGKVARIEDYLERRAALAAAGIRTQP